MRRVLLVNTNTEQAPYPVPPLGLGLVAGRLEGAFEVRVFDGMFQGAAGLAAALADFDPDYVGVGIRNIDDVVMARPIYYIDAIARDFIGPIREHGRAKLVLGGSGFSLFSKELLELLGADFGVVGEGEEAFFRLLLALESGGDPLAVPGVVARSGGRVVRVAPAPKTGVLHLAESRIDTLVDYTPYRVRSSYPVQTKRGCVHRCLYCSYPCIEGSAFRLRPPGEVADEIAAVRDRLGDVSIELVDSTFNDPPGHAEALCAEIARRGLEVRLRTMGLNPAGVTDGLVSLMRRAGFAQIDCTPDTASPRMLERLCKNFSLAELERTAGILRAHGMPTMWFLVLGGPGETEETIAETFDFVDRCVAPEDMVHVTCGLRIYPGTGLREVALAEGVIRAGDSLLQPAFYVAPGLGAEHLAAVVREAAATRPNCVPAVESTADPAMIREALELRAREGLDEPMFRSLLSIRRRRMRLG